jgi:ribose-phosphate pyrophosphokinase
MFAAEEERHSMSEDLQTLTLARRDTPVVIAGRSGKVLGEQIAWGLGGYLHPVKVASFADGEIEIELEASIRGRHVFIVQTLATPIHDSMMELVLLIDACRRASAAEITLVVPYLAYSRQDRKARPRAPISAKVVARMLETAGADRMITFDLHSGQVQGFYEIPCDNLPGAAVLAPFVKKALLGDNVCVVATDVGGMDRARRFAARLGDEIPLAVVDKRRVKANEVASATVIGDVAGMHCILIDDMIDTAGTLMAAADALRSANASAVSMVVTHGLFNGEAVRRVAGAGLQNLWVTDSLPQKEDVLGLRGVTVVSVAGLLMQVIKRVVHGDSLQDVYG